MKFVSKSLLSVALLAAVGCTDKAPDAGGTPGIPATAAGPTTAAPLQAATPTQSVDGPDTISLPADLQATVAAGDAKKGEALYASKGCKACHNLDATRLVGPGFQGVASRRTVKWMARMLLKPEVMVKDDAEAKKLLGTYMVPMANQNVDPVAELPHLLAFLQTKK